MEGPRRWKFFRRMLPAGCLLLGLGCVSDPNLVTRPDGAVTQTDNAAHKKLHAQTCAAFAEFQARAAADPGRAPLEKEHMQDQARRAYEQALKIDPTYLPAYVGLGRLYQAISDADRALATYKHGLEHLPKAPALWYEQGVCQARHRQWPAAVVSLQSAVAQDPENRSYLKILAFCLGRTGHYDESLACFRKVTGEAQAHFDLARLLHHMHEDQRCRQELKLALAAQPDLVAATKLLAQLDHSGEASAPTKRTATEPIRAEEKHPVPVMTDADSDAVVRIGAH